MKDESKASSPDLRNGTTRYLLGRVRCCEDRFLQTLFDRQLHSRTREILGYDPNNRCPYLARRPAISAGTVLACKGSRVNESSANRWVVIGNLTTVGRRTHVTLQFLTQGYFSGTRYSLRQIGRPESTRTPNPEAQSLKPAA